MSKLTHANLTDVDWAQRFREHVLAQSEDADPKTIADNLTEMGLDDVIERELALYAIRASLRPGGTNHDLTEGKRWARDRERAEWALALPKGTTRIPFDPKNSVVDGHLERHLGDEKLPETMRASASTIARALTTGTNKRLKHGDVEVYAQNVDDMLRDARMLQQRADDAKAVLSARIEGQQSTLDAKDQTIAALEAAVRALNMANDALSGENAMLREKLGIEPRPPAQTSVPARHNA